MSESPIDPEDELLIEGGPIPAAEREWQDADGDIGASELPNERSADELERRRRSELAGQKRAVQEARQDSRSAAVEGASGHEPGSAGSNAEQAKENERQAEEDGRELPG